MTWNINNLQISSQWMKIEDFRNTTLVVDIGPMLTFWSMLTSKIIGWFNSVTRCATPLQISRESGENWGFYNYHLSCWPWAYVDLLVDDAFKNYWLVEFSDKKYKRSSNFKSIGWKLRILEIRPKLLTFSLYWLFDLLTSNKRLLPDDKLYHVVKSREDLFKIVTWRQ